MFVQEKNSTKRSENQWKLKFQSFRISYGKRAFSVYGPRKWNAMPSYLRKTSDHKLYRKELSFFQLLLKLLFRRKIDSKQKRSSRINEIKKNLWRRGCSLVELKGPYRKLIAPPCYKKTYETCILGSSLVFGVFIENALTVSCPGGCISTLCSNKIFDDLKTYNIKNVIVLAGTNNLFDKRIALSWDQ